MKPDKCRPHCRAYNEELANKCQILFSLKQMAEGMKNLSAASGLYTQNAEAGWHP